MAAILPFAALSPSSDPGATSFEVFIPDEVWCGATRPQIRRARLLVEALLSQGWVIEREQDILRAGSVLRGRREVPA